ncbi:hypothetical protein FRC11_001165, partial [Ceratobasidium sp. 423]
MNELAPDACVPGNHEFDYSRERFNQLVEFCNFPWVLSNIGEKTKDNQVVPLKDLLKYLVLEVEVDQQTLRIGIIGLMSKDTISKTDISASENFEPPLANMEESQMKETCMALATELREGPEKCDLVIALTHALYEEDIELGKYVNCYTAAGFSELSKSDTKLEDTHGVDLILGGHDH